MVCLSESGQGKGRAYNLSQDETVSAEYMIRMMADMLKSEFGMIAVPRARLEKAGLLPACSPFHGKWMSELDNTRSKKELGFSYTPLEEYLEKIVRHYVNHPELQPAGFEEAREKEKQIAQNAFD